ncbi:MAG: hypothetical protein AAB328_15130, partial [candidate division NC10 bacterium]
AREVDALGREVRVVCPPQHDAALRRALIRENPFVHSSVMLRRALCEQAGGYDEALPVAQDYDLWMRMSRATRLANLDDVLVVRRLLPGRISVEREGDRLRTEARVRWEANRRGDNQSWSVVHALRPTAALALPPALRRGLRIALGR